MQKSVRPFEGDQPTSVERRKRGRAPGTREVSGTLLGHFRSIRLKPSPEDGMPACNFTCVAYCSFFVLLLSNRAEQAPFLRVFDALGSKIVFEINDDESRLDGFPLPILGSFTPPPSAQPVLTANHVCCALLVMQYSQYSVLMLRPLFVTPIVSLICAMELHIYHGVLFALLEQERPLARRVDFALLCQQMTKS